MLEIDLFLRFPKKNCCDVSQQIEHSMQQLVETYSDPEFVQQLVAQLPCDYSANINMSQQLAIKGLAMPKLITTNLAHYTISISEHMGILGILYDKIIERNE